MPAYRFFYPHSLEADQIIEVTDEEAHHLLRVMRKSLGETVEVINGQGDLASATLIAIEKRKGRLNLTQVTHTPPFSRPLILAQAIPRPNRLRLIVEKATELGITDLWLFESHCSERSLNNHELAKLQAIATASLKQCGRLYLPKIQAIPSIDQWPTTIHSATFSPQPNETKTLNFYFGQTAPAPHLMEVLLQCPPQEGALIAIGPEGGFTSQEEEELSQRGQGVSLHSSILRTETASLVALSLLHPFLLRTYNRHTIDTNL